MVFEREAGSNIIATVVLRRGGLYA